MESKDETLIEAEKCVFKMMPVKGKLKMLEVQRERKAGKKEAKVVAKGQKGDT